jgi:formamidopyrimidine-DNA glycosylase
MPELPEVEIVRQSLNKKIIRKTIKKVIVRNRNLRFKVPVNFKKFLENHKILKVDRFSKYLILFLSGRNKLLIHLGMSGTIHLLERNKKNILTNTSFYNSPKLPSKHNHIEIFFDQFKLVYNDPRRFGFFEIIKDNKSLKKRFEKLGPEPFNSRFTAYYIYNNLKDKKKDIKNFLLDQNFISGIGNIYASEILYLSKINPSKKGKSINKAECEKIFNNSKLVLLNAIKRGGSSIRNFKDLSGKKGSFQNDFKVYQREGLQCKRTNCKGIIQKKNISNRSTFFCQLCQK